MIVVRNVLQVEPERMKDVKATTKELMALSTKLGLPTYRAMTDVVGEFYTLVLEMEVSDLGAFEKNMKSMMANPEWQKLYGKVRGAIRGGRREMYEVIS